VPVLTSLLAASHASSSRRPSSPSAIRHMAFLAVIRGPRWRSGPVRTPPSQRSSGLRSLRARLRNEVPGFGAVLIARSAVVTDRGAGLPADPRSLTEPAAGGETAVALGACSRPSGGSLSLLRLSARSWRVRVPTQSPFGSILRDRGSDSVPIRSLLSSSSCLGERDPAHGTRIPVADTCATAGTRWEPGGNPSGTCVGTGEAAGPAVPRFERYGGPRWRPVPDRVHHPYKGARRLRTVTP
jgi:hypothetical protein